MHCGNQVVENGRKKKFVATKLSKSWGGIKKKKIYANDIGKMKRGKIVAIDLWHFI